MCIRDRDGSQNTVLTWDLQGDNASALRDGVYIFRSQNKTDWGGFATPFDTISADSTTWIDSNVTTGIYYYYIRPKNVIGMSAESTMAARRSIYLNYNSDKKNDNWISLPTNSSFATAGDIVMAIEGGTGPNTNQYISAINKWDPVTQGVVESYSYSSAGPPSLHGWKGGSNFEINPGDGINIQLSGNTAEFDWVMNLITDPLPYDSYYNDPTP